ncbi:MAG TPA: dihydrofolate reductase family protein [Blastocatellia bacterium]|nr:dihydrofolate reductase family protein [Blastocatellia bacterium]
MCKLMVNISLSIDGVIQAPGRPDEDTRGGFTRGGWAVPYFDPMMFQTMGQEMAKMPALLLGRRTYEDFYKVWPGRTDNPFTEVLDNSQKYVASTTLKEPLPWKNSTLLAGDAAEAVATLKKQQDKDLVVLGSAQLVQSLMRHGLVDEYVLSIHPLAIGSGRRLFPDDGPFAPLRLVDTKTTGTGVIIATYRPA